MSKKILQTRYEHTNLQMQENSGKKGILSQRKLGGELLGFPTPKPTTRRD